METKQYPGRDVYSHPSTAVTGKLQGGPEKSGILPMGAPIQIPLFSGSRRTQCRALTWYTNSVPDGTEMVYQLSATSKVFFKKPASKIGNDACDQAPHLLLCPKIRRRMACLYLNKAQNALNDAGYKPLSGIRQISGIGVTGVKNLEIKY
jgi:hypothetical protein